MLCPHCGTIVAPLRLSAQSQALRGDASTHFVTMGERQVRLAPQLFALFDLLNSARRPLMNDWIGERLNLKPGAVRLAVHKLRERLRSVDVSVVRLTDYAEGRSAYALRVAGGFEATGELRGAA